MRGPGNGQTGYCYLDSTTPKPITRADRPGSSLAGTLRADTLSGSEREVNIQVTPDLPGSPARVIVEVRYNPADTTDPWIRELDIPAPGGIPATYKFGLLASTGRLSDVHLIRGVRVDTIAALGAMRLDKQIDRSGPALPAVITPGMSIPYQFTVTNSGPTDLEHLTIVDDLAVTAISCDRTTLTVAPAPGSTAVCRGTYLVAPGATGAISNTAVARASRVGLPTTVESNPSTVTVPLVSSLAVTKAITSSPPYVVGQVLQYRYTVTNTGASELSNVVVTDNRITRQSDIACPQADLTAGASMVCTGRYTLAAGDVASDGRLTNTARASADTALGQQVTSATAQQTIPVNTDVAIAKTVDDPTPVVGDNVTFTVTATNNGPAVAQNVVVTDVLAAPRFALVSQTATVGAYDVTTGRWSIPQLAVGQTATLTVVATVGTNDAATNGATLTAMRQSDINPSNNTASVTLNPIVPTLDLAVTSSVDATDIPLGGRARFTVRVDNNGPFPGTGISVVDVLPPGLVYDPATSNGDGSYDPATGTWTIGPLPVGGSATRTFEVIGDQLGTYTNLAATATVTPTDTNPDNNANSAVVQVRAPRADLSIVKHVLPQSAVVGDAVVYQVEVLNKGPEPLDGVFVTDVDPPGVSLDPTSPPTVTKGTVSTGPLRWDVGALAVGESATATVTARLDTPGTKVNTATVDAPFVADPDPSDNQSTATLTASPVPVDVAVTKTVTVDSGAPLDRVPLGDTVTFHITASNQSGADATNVVLTDIADPAYTILTATPSAGTFSLTTNQWTIPTLAAAGTTTLTIQARTTAVGQHSNTIAVSTLDQADTDPADNSATATVTVTEQADLAITKTNSTPTAQPGERVDYFITVTDHGPNAARGVTAFEPAFTDALIVGVAVPDGTKFDITRRLWTIGDVAVGQSVTLRVTIQVRDGRFGRFVNQVAVNSAGVADPHAANNGDDAALYVPTADVAVTNHVDRPTVAVGDTVTFTVGVDNLGPDPAHAVTLDDVLPAGLTLLSATPSTGSYDPTSGIWNIGDLPPVDLQAGQAAPQETLRIAARVDGIGPFTTTATSDRSRASPYDRDNSNNSASAAVTGLAADLALTKYVEPATVTVGATITFTFDVTNHGPATSTAVELHDTFPAEVLLTSADERCTITGQQLDCPLGDIDNTTTITITATATATRAGAFTNTATIDAATPDPNLADNTASVNGTITTPITTTTTTTSTTTPSTTTIARPAPTTNAALSSRLPTTGGSAHQTPVVAAALTLLGLGAVAVTRRRHPREPQ